MDQLSEDPGRIQCRTPVLVADDDQVRLEHALVACRDIPIAELAIFSGTSPSLFVEKPELCNHIIEPFLTIDLIQTYATIRRG